MRKIALPITIIIIIFLSLIFLLTNRQDNFQSTAQIEQKPIQKSTSIPTIETNLQTPQNKLLENDYHVFQTFNNCGPAALSMALSYYGINISQEELGQDLRPYQNPQGDNDDKSVTLEELAEKSKEYDFIPYHRPNGNIEIIKQFIVNDIPIITRTWLKKDEDIGHFRVIKGYDDTNQQLIQDDSLQGKNLEYSYDEFNDLWKKFNYEYLVLVPKDKQIIAEAILKENTDPKIAWEKALQSANRQTQSGMQEDSKDIYARFNLSVALYHTGDYQKAVEEFEKIENQLPSRTLWYQIEPIQAYYELENYQKVFEITDKILNNQNRAFSELYLIRGKIYQKQGNLNSAKEEFEKAVFYNKNLKIAQDTLRSIQ